MPAGTSPSVYIEHTTATATWTGETGNSLPVNATRFIANSIQNTGTGTMTVQGSNDGINWSTLNAQVSGTTGVPLTGVAAGSLYEIIENPIWIRVVAASGSINAILVLRTSA
jgi:hypothetical protein